MTREEVYTVTSDIIESAMNSNTGDLLDSSSAIIRLSYLDTNVTKANAETGPETNSPSNSPSRAVPIYGWAIIGSCSILAAIGARYFRKGQKQVTGQEFQRCESNSPVSSTSEDKDSGIEISDLTLPRALSDETKME